MRESLKNLVKELADECTSEAQLNLEERQLRETHLAQFLKSYHGMTFRNIPIAFDSKQGISVIKIWWHFYDVWDIKRSRIVFSPSLSKFMKNAAEVIVKMESKL